MKAAKHIERARIPIIHCNLRELQKTKRPWTLLDPWTFCKRDARMMWITLGQIFVLLGIKNAPVDGNDAD